ncbi:MAG: oligosaccharide flippase family protein [Rhodoblastus sp.]|nr:MAG: oligosaccharide flippase family protein [Rhodoblastus sp.]
MSVVFAFALNTIFNFAIGLLVAKHLGPAEYGRIALASATATFINTALFDWLRQAATRFYSSRSRETRPEVRATLDLTFGLMTLALGVGAIALTLSGVEIVLSGSLLALAAAGGCAHAMFDFHAAIVRARFDDKTYVRMVAVKHLLGLALTVGGAWWFQDARVALAGMCASVAGSVLAARRRLIDPDATPALARRALARSYMAYGLPLVLAGVIAQAAPLLIRTVVAQRFGFAEMGQFALAYDIGLKLVAAVSSTLDVMLFQLAVRADELEGRAEAKAQIGRNLAIVAAVTAATCVGFWLILPSFEALLVPQSYHGHFSRYLVALLPGFFAFGVMQYGVTPIFQIAQRTLPVIAGALISLAVACAATLLAPLESDATWLARAQSLGVCLGAAALLVFATTQKPVWPRPRDLAAIVLGSAAMAVCVAPLRHMAPGALTLAIQVGAGLLVCTPLLLAFDVGSMRGALSRKLRHGRA